MRSSNYDLPSGERFSIIQIEPDVWELASDKGLCSGVYNGYIAAAWAAWVVARDGEHLIDQIDRGEPLAPHEIMDQCVELLPASE